jgi:hypothetical protein
MTGLNKLADELQPGIRWAQQKLQEVSDYLDNMGPTIRSKSEWQPIETAPKDGTPILARLGPFVYIVFWSDDSKLKSPIPWWEMGSAEWENNKWIGYHEEYYAASPTHWMALPEGPK